jgi:hypothetical protein
MRDDIVTEREQSLSDMLDHQNVRVDIWGCQAKPILSYRIDDRDVRKVAGALITDAQNFSMTNILTGTTIWMTEFQNNTKASCELMVTPPQ